MSNEIEAGGPRLRGVNEHLQRVRYFYMLAHKEADIAGKFRLMVAAVYSCRAITELMLEAAEKEKPMNSQNGASIRPRDVFESNIAARIPFYYLIERIRIHDFHRFGIVPPKPNYQEFMLGGPIRLKAQKGGASVAIAPEGIRVTKVGSSSIKYDRPLLINGDSFFDEEQNRFVTLEEILSTFLAKVPPIIKELEGI